MVAGGVRMMLDRAALRFLNRQPDGDPRRIADLMTRDPVTVRPDHTLHDVIDHVLLSRGHSFAPVVETGKLLGYVDLPIIRRIDREHWGTTVVDDVIESLSAENAVAPDLPIHSLLARMAGGGRRKFMVATDGALTGVITLADLSLCLPRPIAAGR